MRKNSSKSSHHSDKMFIGDIEDMSDDEFFEQFGSNRSRKLNKRKRDARRRIERYQEDKELARWITDYHLESYD